MKPRNISTSGLVSIVCLAFAACGGSTADPGTDLGTDLETISDPGTTTDPGTTSDPGLPPDVGIGETGDADLGNNPDPGAPDDGETGPCTGCMGDPCSENSDCLSAFCLEGPNGLECTDSCVDSCPMGYTCKPVGGEGEDVSFVCVYKHLRYCYPCNEDGECGHPLVPSLDNRCLPVDEISGSFCATDCVSDEECPTGSRCALVGEGDAAVQLCTPDETTCSCSEGAVNLGASTSCTLTNDSGSCQGQRTCIAAGLTDCDAPVPVDEVCNGIDDDCNDETDELFPEFEAPCDGLDVDQCEDGTTVCVEGALACDDDEFAVDEICDGLDNDCDGETDESFLEDGVPCDGDDDDGCEDGTTTCVTGLLVCNDDLESIVEVCDGVDNDCDGDLNETFPEAGLACDGADSDSCEDGLIQCVNGVLECDDDVESVVEVCDGMDNDCDNDVDEDYDLLTDKNNCGACGYICDLPNAVSTCENGDCAVLVCHDGYKNCDGVVANGCETEVYTAANNCGSCGGFCQQTHATNTCVMGVCTPACHSGYSDCDGNPNNGCETNSGTSESDCGFCGNICDPPNASGNCVGGICKVGSCESGYGNCDFDGFTGCETNIITDISNCGSCGNLCSNSHGNTSCGSGTCQPICSGQYGDCNGDSSDGCEASLLSNYNCGYCGGICNPAHASGDCDSGFCALDTCHAPFCTTNNLDCDHNLGTFGGLTGGNYCTAPLYIGAVSGDQGGGEQQQITGKGSGWYSAWISENQYGEDNLLTTVKLNVPASADYDLWVYEDDCSDSPASSLSGGSNDEQINLDYEDDSCAGFACSGGDPDDGHYIYIKVEFWGPTSPKENDCTDYTFTLTVKGSD